MTASYDLNQVQAGWSAHGSDGDKIGDIEEVAQNYLLVTKGLIFPTDLYIPVSAIQQVDSDQGQVWLNVDKSQVDDMGWKEPPQGDGWAAEGSMGSGSAVMSDSTSTGYVDTDTTTGTYSEGTSGNAGYATQSTSMSGSNFETGHTTGQIDHATTQDSLRVPVHEEELRATKVREQAGEVQVGKHVVQEERTLDVPVTREEVEIRRVATDRPATASDDAFASGDTIRVPISAEQVEVSKEARVVEEIEISKRPVTETQRVSDTVRRERVDVDESGQVLTGAGASMTGTGHEFDSTTSGVQGTGYGDEGSGPGIVDRVRDAVDGDDDIRR